MNKVNQQVSKYIPAELQNLLDAASSPVSQILTKALFGNEVSEDDGTVLFSCRDNEKVTDRAWLSLLLPIFCDSAARVIM